MRLNLAIIFFLIFQSNALSTLRFNELKFTLSDQKVEYATTDTSPASLNGEILILVVTGSPSPSIVQSYSLGGAGASINHLRALSTSLTLSAPGAILLYADSSAPANYANIEKTKIIDSIPYDPGDGSSTAFTAILPEWDKKYLSTTQNHVQRCFNSNANDPLSWVEGGTESFGSENDCSGLSPRTFGDPHFQQRVIDSISGKSLDICYDVTGRAGQSINILNDKYLKTKVEGVLKDDYYMHEIRITHGYEKYSITKDSLILPNQVYQWENTKTINYNSITAHMTKSQIIFDISFKNYYIKINIDRVEHFLVGSYLNVNFFGISKVRSRYSGLIGTLGNMNFTLLNSVQNGKEKMLKVDNKLVSTEYKERFMSSCYLINIKNIFNTQELEKFIYF